MSGGGAAKGLKRSLSRATLRGGRKQGMVKPAKIFRNTHPKPGYKPPRTSEPKPQTDGQGPTMRTPRKEKTVRPSLADLFIHSNLPMMATMAGGKKSLKFLQGRVRSAHKFVFDAEASERVAKVVHDIPELIMRESRFARAPYDLTWFEYEAVPYWEAVMEYPEYRDDYQDRKVGFLVDHNAVYTMAQGVQDQPHQCGLFPICYHLNTEWPVQDQILFAENVSISRAGIDRWFWGSSANYYLKRGEGDRLRELRGHNRADFMCHPNIFKLPADILMGANGDLRTIIAFLLILNRPSICKYVHTIPNRRGWVGNKPVPYMSHTTINVDLDAVKTIKLVGTAAGESTPKRRHEVRGHYCHDETAREYMRIAGCIHSWVQTTGPEEKWTPAPHMPADECNNWVCSQCGGKRWWQTEHFRGHGGVGYVVQDGYDVTSRKE